MNWSHALLVVSIFGCFAWLFIGIEYSSWVYLENHKGQRNLLIAIAAVTVISGALAAGLWH